MSLDQILSELKGAVPAEKTAAAPAPAAESNKVAQAKTELVDALKRAEAAVSTKTASTEAKPNEELQKLASDLASADQEALVKEAQFYGAAICDGFMSRLKQYESASESLPSSKTASANDVEKIAQEAVRGYIETQTRIKHAAAEEYKRGYNDTLVQIEKVASDVFSVGAQDCHAVLQQLQA
jgi:translation initiation factor 2B subunit (eIF-2B alpha/beta/delta family)